jgi:hypothetical protein
MSLISWDKYIGGSQCLSGGSDCSMIRDDYLPWLEIPDVMTQVDPLWTSCHRSWYMPPVSLVPLVGALQPLPTGTTDTGISQTTPAVPSSALAAPTPEAT